MRKWLLSRVSGYVYHRVQVLSNSRGQLLREETVAERRGGDAAYLGHARLGQRLLSGKNHLFLNLHKFLQHQGLFILFSRLFPLCARKTLGSLFGRGGGDDPEVVLEKHCKSCKACVVAYAAADRREWLLIASILYKFARIFDDSHGFCY